MRTQDCSQQGTKLPYSRPEVKTKGSVVELTQQQYKQLGGSDGVFLQVDDSITPLGNLS